MKRLFAIAVVALSMTGPDAVAADSVAFATIDVYIDSPQPFASWQFRLSDRERATTIVGVENGDSDAFPDAPWFDRDAVADGRADRLIVADYSLAEPSRLPSGRTRIATLHVMLDAARAPDYRLELVTVTTADGTRVVAAASYVTRTVTATGSRQ